MNRLTILQLCLAAVLILQAFAWTPPVKTTDAAQVNAPAEQLVYRTKTAEAERQPMRFSF
jgi:hypothetical protein